VSFSNSYFHISTPSLLFNVVTRDSVHRTYFNIKNGERWDLAIDEKDLFGNDGRTAIKTFVLLKRVHTFANDCTLRFVRLQKLSL